MAVHTAAHHSSGQVLPFRESLLAMIGISFVTMLVALDQTVVGTALPYTWSQAIFGSAHWFATRVSDDSPATFLARLTSTRTTDASAFAFRVNASAAAAGTSTMPPTGISRS